MLQYAESLFETNCLEVFANGSERVGIVTSLGDRFTAIPNQGRAATFGSQELALKYFERLTSVGKAHKSGNRAGQGKLF